MKRCSKSLFSRAARILLAARPAGPELSFVLFGLRGGVPGDGGRHGRACAAGQKMTKACPFFRRGAGQARQSEV